MTKTSAKQKALLIIFGLLLGVFLLEAGLRLAGFVLTFLQEGDNRGFIKEKGEYVVMCLGESTTVGGYPKQLEQVLNNRNLGMKFRVINKGINGTNSAVIVSQLKENLDRYKPDMVITMMGINDDQTTMVYEDNEKVAIKLFFQGFRVYKLAKLLREHIVYQIGEITRERGVEAKGTISKSETSEHMVGQRLGWGEWLKRIPIYEKMLALEPNNIEALIGLGMCYREYVRYPAAEEMFARAAKVDPRNGRVYLEWAKVYSDQHRPAEAEEKYNAAEKRYQEAINSNPAAGYLYVDLERLYLERGKWKEAKEIMGQEMARFFHRERYENYLRLARENYWLGRYETAEYLGKIAVEISPRSSQAYTFLGRIFYRRSEKNKAAEMFNKAIEINPYEPRAYGHLGAICESREEWAAAEEMYKKAIEINPSYHLAFWALTDLHLRMGKFGEIEELCRKILELEPEDERAWEALALCYEGQDKKVLAETYFRKADKIKLNYTFPATAKNYRKLKEIVDSKGVRLVCMQYPMRHLEHLKRLLPERDGIILVDNEEVFQEAVREEGHSAYFLDCFAGDFGHCNLKGNRLIAESAANAIIKECFQEAAEGNPGNFKK